MLISEKVEFRSCQAELPLNAWCDPEFEALLTGVRARFGAFAPPAWGGVVPLVPASPEPSLPGSSPGFTSSDAVPVIPVIELAPPGTCRGRVTEGFERSSASPPSSLSSPASEPTGLAPAVTLSSEQEHPVNFERALEISDGSLDGCFGTEAALVDYMRARSRLQASRRRLRAAQRSFYTHNYQAVAIVVGLPVEDGEYDGDLEEYDGDSGYFSGGSEDTSVDGGSDHEWLDALSNRAHEGSV